MPADHQADHRQQENRAGQWQQDAQIEPIQRLDVADQAGEQVAGLAKAQPPCPALRQATEKPHAQIGERAEGGGMGDQSLEIAQHDARGAEGAQDAGCDERAAGHRDRERCSGDGHQADPGGQGGERDDGTQQQPTRPGAPQAENAQQVGHVGPRRGGVE